MKVRINKAGNLQIERAGKWKDQYCPFNNNPNCLCGDWCPLFGEPEYYDENVPVRTDKARHVNLEICREVFIIKNDEFKDERVSK